MKSEMEILRYLRKEETKVGSTKTNRNINKVS